MDMKLRLLSRCLVLGALFFAIHAWGQNIPLSGVQPVRIFSYFPNQDATPASANLLVPGRTSPESALAFKVESEVTYAVPANQVSFSGILVYQPPKLELPSGEAPYYVPVLIRIIADGKTILEQGLNEATPPFQFSIPIGGISQITIASKTAFVGNQFYLADAHFSSTKEVAGRRFMPGWQQGYVDCAPAGRQEIYGIYNAGEEVAVAAYFGGIGAQSVVSLRFTPEAPGQSVFSIEIRIPLNTVRTGISQGAAIWKVPKTFGPGRLEISEVVAGQTVFSRELRIGIGPSLDLAEIGDSSFGFHASTNGYPLIYDEFAGLWGAKWGRIFLHWSAIEPKAGEYDFSRVDDLVGIYQAQHMRLLVAVGEDFPAWVGAPGPAYTSAWQDFVSQVAHHLAGKVNAWDIFNEVDVKYTASMAKGAPPDWDIGVLKSAIRSIRAADPRTTIVCCSTGTTQWLPYDKKLLDAGVLPLVDAISLHPYQPGPPEVKDGPFNYPERIAAVSSLAGGAGVEKPIWSTEANWIIGSAAATDITAPALTELQQAEYVVRVNLISATMGVKYFLHAPFAHRSRPQTHLATWAAYAQMASLFSIAGKPTLALSGPQVFAVIAPTTDGGYVGAAWSVGNEADISFSAIGERFMDIYGNTITGDPSLIHISPAPLYFTGKGAVPGVRVISQVPSHEWISFPQVASWFCSHGTTCNQVTGGLFVQSSPSKYAYQLLSPVMNVQPNSCELVRVDLTLEKGSVGVFALDTATGKMLDRVAYASWVPDGHPRTMDLRFHTTATTQSIKIVLANSNFTDVISSFTILNRPQITACP